MSAQKPSPTPKLNQLGVANFKAFGPHLQNIPLRPITLVFGPNSGGKSSLLHFLLWMKDVVCPPQDRSFPLDVYWPTAGDAKVEINGSRQGVDLGGFKQFRHGLGSETEVQSQLNLKLKGQDGSLDIQVTSHFATRVAPHNYRARLRAKVSELFAIASQKNSIDKLLQHGESLSKVMIERTLTEVIGAEYGEHRLKLWFEAALDKREHLLVNLEGVDAPDFSKLFEEASPKLARYVQAHEPGLDILTSVLREEPIITVHPLDQTELLSELQNLVCRMFDELKHVPSTMAEAHKPSLVRFEIRSMDNLIMLADRNDSGELELQSLDLKALRSLLDVSAESLARFEKEEATCRIVFDDTVHWLPGKLRGESDAGTSSVLINHITALLEGAEPLLNFLPNEAGLMGLCNEAAKNQLSSLSYLGPIRAYPSREIKVSELPEAKDSHGWFAWRRLSSSQTLLKEVNGWLKAQKSSLQVAVGHYAMLEQFGADVAKLLLDQIDHRKRDVMAKEKLESTTTGWDFDGWDAKADVQKALEVAASPQHSERTTSVFLQDSITNKIVSCRDIGVGISQLIPVLVQAMDSQDEIIVMEQPELHLHPRLQAELGDVFIKSALERGNTFVMETHSEHLILRIMRRMRETFEGHLPDGSPPVTPNDVCILYVEQDERGSIVREMPLNERGELIKGWPGGFFEEALNEMF